MIFVQEVDTFSAHSTKDTSTLANIAWNVCIAIVIVNIVFCGCKFFVSDTHRCSTNVNKLLVRTICDHTHTRANHLASRVNSHDLFGTVAAILL